MKLVKPFTPHVIAWSVRKDFNQSSCRTKEQKARLQCLASAMSKSVMPSAIEKRKEKKVQESAVIAETPRQKRFFFSKTFKQQR